MSPSIQQNLAPQIYSIQDLTESQKAFIKASVPILESSGELLTSKFYNKMLNNFPEVKPFFNETNQKNLKQPRILAFAVLNYAKNIDDLTPLLGFVHQIVVKHVGLQVKAEHYPIVGSCLLGTMKELLGEEIATPEFLKAWEIAYGNLAQILINAEFEQYQQQDWNGFKEFRVTRLIDESNNVKSVYFSPLEGKIALPKRGQYVCIRWTLPGDDVEKSREYSLSEFPKTNEYRISVRKLPDGKISNYVHNDLKIGDVLKVSPPAGQFTYQETDKDLILFVGGIGITPIISILEKALNSGKKVDMYYSNKTIESRPFTEYLKNLKKYKFNLKEYISNQSDGIVIDQAEFRPLESSDFDRMDLVNKDIYLLGPTSYMKFVQSELSKKGISNVFSEFFGPTEV